MNLVEFDAVPATIHMADDRILVVYTFITAVYAVMLGTDFEKTNVSSTCVFAWNALLAVYSVVGGILAATHFITNLAERGFHDTMCSPVFYKGIMGLCSVSFVLSKPVELIDTLLLKLRCKNVKFLHSFHHISVMWYSYHAFIVRNTVSILFMVINLNIHALMYTYYACTQTRLRRHPLMSTVGNMITRLQITQMWAGLLISAYFLRNRDSCTHMHVHDTIMGAAIYAVYLFLFTAFYAERWSRVKTA